MSNDSVWLVGPGAMAREYTRVLRAMGITPTVFGRGSASAEDFTKKTGIAVNLTPISDLKMQPPKHAIVCANSTQLENTALLLIQMGTKNILIEKPGALNDEGLERLKNQAETNNANVFIGYNRRFYSSVSEARSIIEEDGGVTSYSFEITEWAHVIRGLDKATEELSAWFYSNTTHVVDLAFHLGGVPFQLSAVQAGALPWHPSASRFAGVGKTSSDATFSYFGDWQAPGSWALELNTPAHRLIFRPLEKLSIQNLGSVEIKLHPIENQLDQEFKPGLFKQTQDFLASDSQILCSLQEHVDNWKWYKQMSGY